MKILYIITDMEGLAGVDQYDQCYGPKGGADYEYGRAQRLITP